MTSRAWIHAAGVLLLALGPAARAERTLTSVAVAADSKLDARALETWRALQEGLLDLPGYVDLARKASPELAGREARAKRARALLDAANDAFERLEVETASARADEALVQLESSDLTRSFPDLLEALAMKALILQARGDSGATLVLNRLLALAPEYRFASPRYNPKFTALAEKIRRKVNGASRTSLEISAEDGSAWVYVDGSYRGVSPLQVKGLAPGTHYVTLLAPGCAVVQGTAEAGSGKPFAEKRTSSGPGAELLTRLEDLAAGLRQRAFVEPARALAAWAKVDEVLAVILEPDGAATLVRVAGANLPPLTTELPAGVDSVGLVSAARALAARPLPTPIASPPPLVNANPVQPKPPPGPATKPPPQQQPPAARTAGNGKAWGFALLGSGTLAGVTGLLTALDARRQADATKTIPQIDGARYATAVRSARLTALVADGLLGLAVVGVGAGTLVLLSQGEPPPPGPAGKGQAPRVSLGVTPLREGGLLTVSGDF